MRCQVTRGELQSVCLVSAIPKASGMQLPVCTVPSPVPDTLQLFAGSKRIHPGAQGQISSQVTRY